MGGVVDTSVFAACERKGWNARKTIAHILQVVPGPILLTSIVAAELIEGIYRARTLPQFELRRAFVSDIFLVWPPIPFTQQTARIAGKIRVEQGSVGNTLPIADSLIAASAIEMDCTVVTLNTKDFTRIPTLRVIPFSI